MLLPGTAPRYTIAMTCSVGPGARGPCLMPSRMLPAEAIAGSLGQRELAARGPVPASTAAAVRARPSFRGMGRAQRRAIVPAMVTERVLWAAWAKVAAGSGMPGVDGVTPERYAGKVGERLVELADLLRSREYRPQPLRALTVTRNGKARSLAVPTVRDRIAQRAFLEAARLLLDSAAAEASFAYRRGRSWLDALGKVERCRDQGLRWVFRGDIEKFFDRIDHGLVQQSLTKLFKEPHAVDLAMAWVRAPVLGPNGLVDRTAGVPQGAPISAALANHYLTPLDEAVDGSVGTLVRYADDLCVCCPDEQAASRASWMVDCALSRVRLAMNPEKTYISSFDRGFSFLGWVFFRHDGWEEDPSGNWTHPMAVGRNRRAARAGSSRPR